MKEIEILRRVFHRFCGFKNRRISETLSLGEKSLSLAKKPSHFDGRNLEFPLGLEGKNPDFGLKTLEFKLP